MGEQAPRDERCISCDSGTRRGASGRTSLYANGTGPLCEECYDGEIYELEMRKKSDRISTLEGDLQVAEAVADKYQRDSGYWQAEAVRLKGQCALQEADIQVKQTWIDSNFEDFEDGKAEITNLQIRIDDGVESINYLRSSCATVHQFWVGLRTTIKRLEAKPK